MKEIIYLNLCRPLPFSVYIDKLPPAFSITKHCFIYLVSSYIIQKTDMKRLPIFSTDIISSEDFLKDFSLYLNSNGMTGVQGRVVGGML